MVASGRRVYVRKKACLLFSTSGKAYAKRDIFIIFPSTLKLLNMRKLYLAAICLISLYACKKKTSGTTPSLVFPNKVTLTYDGKSYPASGQQGHNPDTLKWQGAPAVINCKFDPENWRSGEGTMKFYLLVKPVTATIGYTIEANCPTNDSTPIGRHKIIISHPLDDVSIVMDNATSAEKKYYCDSGYFTLSSYSKYHYEGNLELYMNNSSETKKVTCDFVIDKPDIQ